VGWRFIAVVFAACGGATPAATPPPVANVTSPPIDAAVAIAPPVVPDAPPPPPATRTVAVGSFPLVADVPADVSVGVLASLAVLSWPDRESVAVQQDDAPRAWKSQADADAEARWFQYPEATSETWPNGFGLLARGVTDGDRPIYIVSAYVHVGGHYYACGGNSLAPERRAVMAAICRSIRVAP
jgi:hypothetical protein